MHMQSYWKPISYLICLTLFSLQIACGGKKNNSTGEQSTALKITGQVTYVRIPRKMNPDGTPSEFETDPAKFKVLPARGVSLRTVIGKTVKDPNGKDTTIWMNGTYSLTDSEGKYILLVEPSSNVYVELMSETDGIRIVASKFIDTKSIVDRPSYFLRKGIKGNEGGATPGSIINSDAKVDFAVKLDTPWWIGHLSTYQANNAKLETKSTETGSRVRAILDSIYGFKTTIGYPKRSIPLSLHYCSGSNDNPHGSFIEYDLANADHYPKPELPKPELDKYADGHVNHSNDVTYLFGTLRKTRGKNLDDAFDESVIYQLFARYVICQQLTSIPKLASLYPPLDLAGGYFPTTSKADRSDMKDLRPDMALVEGLTDAMTAIALKSPFITATSSAEGQFRDIRIAIKDGKSDQGNDIYSAANISRTAWKLSLYANGTLVNNNVTPLNDEPAGWAKMNFAAMKRFFYIIVPTDADHNPTDLPNLYTQLTRLQEDKTAGEPADLKLIFTNKLLEEILKTCKIQWQRPQSIQSFLLNWDKDPGVDKNPLGLSFPVPFTMSNANPNMDNIYPNFSKDEIISFRFVLSKGRSYQLTINGITDDINVEARIGKRVFSLTKLDNKTDQINLDAGYHVLALRLRSIEKSKNSGNVGLNCQFQTFLPAYEQF